MKKISTILVLFLVVLLALSGCGQAPSGATNIIYDPGTKLSVVVTDPAIPDSGDPVRYGNATGIALTDEGDGGNASTYTTVDFGTLVCDIPVTATSGAISVGDTLFYADSLDAVNNDSAGYFYGIAMEAVASGTSTINVLHVQSPGSGTLGSGTVGASNLASNAVTTAKILAANVTLAKIAPNAIDGTIAKDIGSGDAIGGIGLLHRIDVPTGATGNIDTTITNKEQIIDAWIVKNTIAADSAANSIQLVGAADTVSFASNALSLNGTAAGGVVRAGNIYSENATISAGGTLRVIRTRAASGDVGCTVYVQTIRVP